MQIGFIGLGKMGANMGERLAGAGHEVVGYDRGEEARKAFARRGGRAVDATADLLEALTPPRVVWLMVPSGGAVDVVLDDLEPGLHPGDVVVDGGNSYYRETLRRAARLDRKNVFYVDAGTSGGVLGLEHGYCLMVGGKEDAVAHVRPLLEALAPAKDRGWGRVGGPGAGHFVKMVHNGIEYGMMQAYAEGFAVLAKKEDFGLDLAHVAEIWRYGSVVQSLLLDLTAEALADERRLESVEPWVDDSGEGRWTVFEAIDLDVAAPVITLALQERFASRERDSFAYKLLAAMRGRFGGHAVRRKEG